jgi:hypothetical protein
MIFFGIVPSGVDFEATEYGKNGFELWKYWLLKYLCVNKIILNFVTRKIKKIQI